MTPIQFIKEVESVTKHKAANWEVKAFVGTANILFPNGLQNKTVNKLLAALKKSV